MPAPIPDVLRDHLEESRREVAALEADARLSKLPGYFPTPAAVARRMADLAAIQPGERVLDPSAGSGRLIDAALAAQPQAEVDAVEIAPQLRELLVVKRRFTPFSLVASDFLTMGGARGEGQGSRSSSPSPLARRPYDVILMNPPFERGQDLVHVRHAFDHHLKPGGRLVAIVSAGAIFRNDRASQSFRAFLADHADEPEGIPIPSGTFEDTNVASVLIVLRKPCSRELARGVDEVDTLDDALLDARVPDYLPLFPHA